MPREIDGGLIVDEGDIVIVSNTPRKRDGVFSRVNIMGYMKGYASVTLHPIIEDKTKHEQVEGKLLPNLSVENSALIIDNGKFIKGKSVSISAPNRLDRIRYFIGQKLLGW